MRIVLADDHAVVRKAFEIMLSGQADIEVAATAKDGGEAYQLVKQEAPDLLLLDISMPPGESGLVAASKIHHDFPDTRIIMLTMYDDREYLLYTLQNGASGFVLKNAPEQELLEAIHTVYGGGVYVSKQMVPYLVQGYLNGGADEDAYLKLREREIEVLTLIAKGYGNKEIADKLYLSVKTVESYKNKIMTKLNVNTRAELVDIALRKHLLQV